MDLFFTLGAIFFLTEILKALWIAYEVIDAKLEQRNHDLFCEDCDIERDGDND